MNSPINTSAAAMPSAPSVPAASAVPVSPSAASPFVSSPVSPSPSPFASPSHPDSVDASGTAVLLINLGTPDAAEPGAVGRYLKEFLSDPRVVEIPALLWQPLLRGVIVPLRSRASAKKYASVWMDEGSPLRVYTERQTLALRARFAELGMPVRVEYAMRYGTPNIDSRIRALQADGIERILLLPMYPQYSASTTATAFDAAYETLRQLRDQPALRAVKSYPTDPGYVAALAEQVARFWREHGTPDFAAGDKLLLSFHGVPKRTITLGDPYQAECLATGARLAQVLELDGDTCQVTFQSRFGKAEWLQPYTEPTAIALAQAGTRRIDVFTPGFTADCLETIEEIGLEVRDAFLHAGGERFRRIPCLNDAPAWIAGLATLCADNLAGWPGGPTR